MPCYLFAVILACALTQSMAKQVLCTPGKYETGKVTIVDLEVGHSKNKTQRKILLYIPKGRSIGRRWPGLVTFHGLHSNPWADVIQYMNQTAYADKYGFSLAIPFGTSWGHPSPICCPFFMNATVCENFRPVELTFDWERACGWNSGLTHPRDCTGISGCYTPIKPKGDPVGKVDDVALAKAAAKFLVEEACVDEAQVFALGFSGGSMMANRVACETGETFHGVAAISGLLDPLVGYPCAVKFPFLRPLHYIMFGGTADDTFMSEVTTTFELWGQKNNCVEVVPTFTTSTTLCAAHIGCDNGVIVERCLLVGMDDQVPGHNRTLPFGTMPFQPTTNIDSIDYLFRRFGSLSSNVSGSALKLV